MPATRMRATGVGLLAMCGALACRPEAESPRLAGMGVSDSAGAMHDGELRRLWAGEDFNFYASSPSPDGRYVTEIDWSTGDLAVRDLASGTLHHLTDKGGWTQSGDYALSSTFSPDGDEVAFVWWNTEHQRHELRALRFEADPSGPPRGRHVRVIYANPAMEPFPVFGWAADGWILTSLRRPDRTLALALVSAETGEARVLESFDWRRPGAVRSPDGRTIAYDLPTADDSPERDIYLFSDDGSKKAVAVEGPADDIVLAWLPDGSALLYGSRQAGHTTVHRLPIVAGSAAGPPEPTGIELPGRIEPLGRAGDVLYVGVTVESAEFHVARVDDTGAARFRDIQPFTDPWGSSMHAWDWSPDGSHIAHDARGEPGSSDFRVVIRSHDGNPIRNFRLEGRADIVRWAPDGRSVLLYAWDREERPGLRSLDLESGRLRTIRQFDGEWQAMGGHFAVSPDAKNLYYRLLGAGAEVRIPTRGSIIRRNLETGEERVVLAVRSGGSLAFSPDGEQLAFVDYDTDLASYVIRIKPASGTAAHVIFRQEEGEIIEGLNWMPDGRSLLFLGGTAGGRYELLHVAATGGEATQLADVPWLAYAEPRLHPDGRRVAFRAGRNLGEIWALDGIGSGSPTASVTKGSR